jgi:adenylate cyclase
VSELAPPSGSRPRAHAQPGRLAVAIALSLAACAVALGLRYAGLLQPIEDVVYDAYLRLERPAAADERILIVEITEADIREQGSWPLSDAMLARVVRQLAEAGAVAIGVDIYRDLPVPPGTAELERTIAETPRAIFVRHVGEGRMRSIPAPAGAEGGDQIGFNDVILDADGTVRRGLLFLEDGEGDTDYSLALRLALLYLAERGVLPEADPADPSRLRLGPTSIAPFEAYDGGYVGADAAGYQVLLDFQGAPAAFRTVTLGALLAGDVPAQEIRGRIVMLGLSAESTNDFFHLPFLEEAATVANAGVAVHAHLTSQLVRMGLGQARPLAVLAEWQEIAVAVALALVAGLGALLIPSARTFAGATVLWLLALWIAGLELFRAGLWLPVAPPALASLGGAVLVIAYVSSQERRQRALLMSLFSRHLSPAIADEVWRRREEFLDGARPRSVRLPVTVLFLDMKGYTATAEKLAPEELMSWVNGFMDAMAGVVMEHGGVVDDYFGDGLKAVFGVPFPRQSPGEVRADAASAVRCALHMEQKLAELNAAWRARGLPTVGLRIGIASDLAVAGSLGSANRLKYTTVGDVVVTAQRLEGFDGDEHDFQARPCRILLGERTREYLDGDFATEKIGDVRLKGKERSAAVFRLVGGPTRASAPSQGGPSS